MNRKEWKRNYKKFSKNKIKRMRSKLKEGYAMERKPNQRKLRRDTK